MEDTRSHFHQELEALEQSIHEIGDRAHGLIGKSIRALVEGDVELAEEVREGDDVIDRMYLDVHNRWINMMAVSYTHLTLPTILRV